MRVFIIEQNEEMDAYDAVTNESGSGSAPFRRIEACKGAYTCILPSPVRQRFGSVSTPRVCPLRHDHQASGTYDLRPRWHRR